MVFFRPDEMLIPQPLYLGGGYRQPGLAAPESDERYRNGNDFIGSHLSSAAKGAPGFFSTSSNARDAHKRQGSNGFHLCPALINCSNSLKGEIVNQFFGRVQEFLIDDYGEKAAQCHQDDKKSIPTPPNVLHPLLPKISLMRIKRLRSPCTLYFCAMNIC